MQPRWKRLAVVLLGLGFCTVLLACGGDADVEPAPTAEPDDGEIRIQLPAPAEPKPLHEQARGIYQLQTEQLRVSLELMHGRVFRFLSMRGEQRREATGTWNLAGNRLVLAYREMDGKPVGEEPLVVTNLWHGRTIELKETGFPGRVVLTKRAMIRRR